MSVAELVFRRENAKIRVRIDRTETYLGSAADCDVVLPDVAELVAVLVDRGAGRFKLRAIGDVPVRRNGAVIDLEGEDVDAGDELTFGDTTLHFAIREDEEFTLDKATTVAVQQAGPAAAATLTHAGDAIPLPIGAPFNIGAEDDNDLVIRDGFTSGYHVRITCDGGHWTITDLDSTNGTKVNGLRVEGTELPSPATIQIGQATLTFETLSAAGGGAGVDSGGSFAGMLGSGPGMRRVFNLIERLSPVDAPVLITGGSGSGKELVARALHDESPRKRSNYLAINCGALAASIIEAELFGHVKGAFTGAMADKKGAFEATQNGTLFLDEIGELPLELQPKLLRVLESRTVRRVGGTSEIEVNTRIVAATHRNLRELVDNGEFREDLFHRLYVLTIPIPDLADRPEDVLPLAHHFLKVQAPSRDLTITTAAEAKLTDYDWPGNVRELKNVLLRAVLLSDGDVLDAEDFEFSEAAFGSSNSIARRVRKVDDAERERIITVLEETGNNRAEAARILGLSKSTFHDRLKRLGIGLKFSGRNR